MLAPSSLAFFISIMLGVTGLLVMLGVVEPVAGVGSVWWFALTGFVLVMGTMLRR